MEKFKVSFSADNQQLKALGTKHASDTYADIEATFVLGEKWTDMDSVSAVWWNDFTKVATVLDSQGKCIVPHEVLTRKGCVRVNLVGSIVEGDELITRLTSYSAEAVQVNEKIKLTGSETSEITPSQYEQFVANVKADADRAEAGATESEQSAQSASESATASANSASDSAQSATASAQSAQNASESAQNAENAKDDAEDARDEILGMRATAETLEAGSDATASYSDGLLTLGIPRGDQGIQGIQGETGATPNLTIGTVETLEPTEDATATITGTAENPVLNLGLPKGDTGDVSLEDLEALLPTETASGEIVTIADGQSVVPAKSLKVTLEPIQDLHGYDKPWSGGGSANKWDEEWEVGSYSSTGQKVPTQGGRIRSVNKIAVLPNTTYYMLKGVYILCQYDENEDFISFTQLGVDSPSNTNHSVTTEATTHYITFATYANYGTTYNHDIAINYPSSVTTYSPYSNICPISGRTEVVTQRTGVNVWDEEWESGRISTTTGADASGNGIRSGFVPILPSTNYYARRGDYTGASSITLYYYDAEKNYLSTENKFGTSALFTTPSNAHYLRFNIMTSDAVTAYNHDISINYPSTDHDYHAYQGDTYTTALGQTVYGGTLDVVSGELVVDRAMVTYDGSSDENWTWENAKKQAYILKNDMKRVHDYRNSLISDRLKTIADAYIPASTEPIAISGYASETMYLGYNWIYIRNQDWNSKADMLAWLVDNPLQVVYELATPQTIQLTPQEVKLLTGTNNIWSDGNVTLVYSADIQRWVEKKLGTRTTLTMSRPTVDSLKSADTVESADTNSVESVDTAQVGDDL